MTKIILPDTPRPRVRPEQWALGAGASATSAALLLMSDLGGFEPRWLPALPAVAWATLAWSFVLVIAFARAATGLTVATRLARRAAFPERLGRIGQRVWAWPLGGALVMGLVSFIPLAFDPALVELEWLFGLLIPAPLLLLAAVAIIRVFEVRAARRFIRRLETTSLSLLEGTDGHVELSLRVADDAPLIELPFLEGRWAAVQLCLDDDHRHTWPERLPVRDESGRGDLHLGALEIGGWRSRVEVVSRPEEKQANPGLWPLFEAAIAPEAMPSAHSTATVVQALRPGDPLYVVGDGGEVRERFGMYRAGRPVVGGRVDLPAAAFLGDEREFEGRLRIELVAQPLVALTSLASAAAVWALLLG